MDNGNRDYSGYNGEVAKIVFKVVKIILKVTL